jgi:hypothetical protein
MHSYFFASLLAHNSAAIMEQGLLLRWMLTGCQPTRTLGVFSTSF